MEHIKHIVSIITKNFFLKEYSFAKLRIIKAILVARKFANLSKEQEW